MAPISLAELAARIPDGAFLAIPPDTSLTPAAFARALAAGTLAVVDATCPAIHTMLQAAEKGVPFMPLRGVLGSDLVPHRPDWKVIDNPFADAGDPILLVA